MFEVALSAMTPAAVDLVMSCVMDSTKGKTLKLEIFLTCIKYRIFRVVMYVYKNCSPFFFSEDCRQSFAHTLTNQGLCQAFNGAPILASDTNFIREFKRVFLKTETGVTENFWNAKK